MNLTFSDISIVIQGNIGDHQVFESEILKKYRDISNDIEIIFSTWKGTNFSSKLLDKYIESDDPGALFVYDELKITNSTARIMASSKAGLILSNRPWILKVRSDIYFENINWLINYSPVKVPLSSENKLFQYKVIVPTYFTPNPSRQQVLFHPGDWFMFGAKSDLISLFSCDLPEEPLFSRFFENKINPRPSNYTWWHKALSQYTGEQYPLLMLMKKKNIEIPEHGFIFDKMWKSVHDNVLGTNFDLISGDSVNLFSLKHKLFYKKLDISSMYTQKEALELARTAGYNVEIPKFDWEKFRRLLYAILDINFIRSMKVLRSFLIK